MGTNEFTTKILPLKNNLFRVVFRITGDVEKSEQIVQEALLKVWEDRDSWIVIENLPSYCMMVARNLALRETYSGNKERMEPICTNIINRILFIFRTCFHKGK